MDSKHDYEKLVINPGSIWLIWGVGDNAGMLDWNDHDRRFVFSLGKLSPPTSDGERRFRFKSVKDKDFFPLSTEGQITGSAARQRRVRAMLSRFAVLVAQDPQALRAMGLAEYMKLREMVGETSRENPSVIPWW